MATNYYTGVKPCSKCGRSERIHIGKYSSGWRFTFRVHSKLPNLKLTAHWLGFLMGKRIFDEYGKEYTLQEFTQIIMDSKGGHWPWPLHEGEYFDEEGFVHCDKDFS